jgi:hypothetical protein
MEGELGSKGVRRICASTVLIAAFACAVPLDAARAAADAPLEFRITEGRTQNAFYQEGPVAAHLLLSDGVHPRILVAFPAGNSGAGLWFEDAQRPVRWTLDGIRPSSRTDERGRMLHGIVAEASVDTPLVIREAVLGSVRVLRDYQLERKYPAELRSIAKADAATIEWARARLDGGAGYVLSIALKNGEIAKGQGSSLRLSPRRASDPLRLTITALTGDTPLTPLGEGRLLSSSAGDDSRSRQVLRFLSYEEKFLAGSWRFNTYFGRDTLMSLRLLLPSLRSEAIERGLNSVLERLSADGEVAHEEDIGEFAVLRHRQQGEPASDAPIYDYKMIDDDFMLAPLAAAYLIDSTQGKARARDFLATRLPRGEQVGSALVRNFAWVARAGAGFAKQPSPANLIALKPGVAVGEWRDSEDGLANGHYPYDVNAVLAPAALSAVAQVFRSRLLDPYLAAEQREALAAAEAASRVWAREAPPLFEFRFTHEEASRRIAEYGKSQGVDSTQALESLPRGDLVASALALDAEFKPIPVIHSDGGFALLFQDPSAAEVERIAEGMLRPFPAGLLTDAGLLVANPVFSSAHIQGKFGPTAYHGTVVWSWQQALVAAGLERQSARNDLPAATREKLRAGQRRLWSAIEATREMRASELWSWRFAKGRYEAIPFGQTRGDADESNAAQLWSTVYLAIPTPRPTP